MSSPTPLTTYAVNANGLGDVMKHAAISRSILTLRPHAAIISETKSRDPVSSRLSISSEYNTFESEGIPCNRGRSSKWVSSLLCDEVSKPSAS